MRRSLLLALMLLAGAVPADHARAAGVLSHVAQVQFKGGTDLDFGGNYAFVGAWSDVTGGTTDSGLWVIDISEPTAPKIASRLPCAGTQNDVGVWRTTAVMGFHFSDQSAGCRAGGGLRILDVGNPAAPRETGFVSIGGGTHTLTIVGDTGYVYSNPGGQGLTAGAQSITIVDIRNPDKPKVAGTFRPPRSLGCHDVNVNADATRAYCAGANVTQIWDITDPVSPVVLAEIVNPAIAFHHGAVPTPDGRALVIGDENLGQHACDGSGASPMGALWFYDITDEAQPQLKGWFQPTMRLNLPGSGWCSAHNFDMIEGTTWLVTAAYRGGTTIVDYGDLARPRAVDSLTMPGANTWSSYFHDGYVYTGDLGRGFDVFAVAGVTPEP